MMCGFFLVSSCVLTIPRVILYDPYSSASFAREGVGWWGLGWAYNTRDFVQFSVQYVS